jgi:signal transduction histidine kinase
MRGFSEEIAKGNLDIPLPIHKNNLFGNLTESFDIMREELKAAKEREVQADKAKKEMVAELSHDIKTPVATVKSVCEVLKVKHGRKLEELEDAASIADEKDILEKTDLIFSKVDMIDHLITDIFHTTLEELDHLELKVKEESSLLIQDYFRNMRMYKDTFKKDIAEEKYITLENDIPECLIFMDRLRMEQVLDNIVGNSAKYAGTEIRVSFEETEGAVREDGRKDKYVRIRIRDFGPGIPEDELPLVTEKYYRGQNAKEQSGYGIGLFLVKNYMEKQGGGMECYNDDGFVVDLYVKKA